MGVDASAETEAGAAPCPNCGAPLAEAYCPRCGQRRARRLTFRGVFSDAFQALTNLDSKFLGTLVGMTLRPGRVTREYVEGRRQAYMNPVKYAFITTTFFVLMINLFDIPVWRLMGERASREGFMAVFSLLSYLVFVNAFAAAVVQRLLFWKGGRNLAECYVFVLFCYGHLALVFLLGAALGAYESWRVYLTIPLAAMAFLAWGLTSFYGTRVWRAVPSALLLVVAYYFSGSLFSTAFGIVKGSFR